MSEKEGGIILTRYSRVNDLMETGLGEAELAWGKNDRKVLARVREKLGPLWLARVGREEIQRAMQEVLRETGSPFMANQFLHVSRELFRYGVRQRVIPMNPAEGIGFVSIIPQKKEGYTAEQWDRIHRAILKEGDLLLLFQLYTGLPMMQDVIHIRIADCWIYTHEIEVGGYESRRRIIPLDGAAWACLVEAIRIAMRRRMEQEGGQEMDYVFSDEDGKKWTSVSLRDRADVIRRESGVACYGWTRCTDHMQIRAVAAGASSADLMHYFGIQDERSAIQQWEKARVDLNELEGYLHALSDSDG